ncbi:MAG: DUF2784 domain-containing protein [Deltaproteobacteria bacterium]|nr:DUF2784 domain-containing protein [Deltaproteobacteria bacterium]
MYHLAANAILLLHLIFIATVIFGGFAVARWPRLAWAHLPAMLWGFLVEAAGWYCPLTDLENTLMRQAGHAAQADDFLARTLLALIYPEGLTREIQIGLAAMVLATNAAIYGWIWTRRRRPRHRVP